MLKRLKKRESGKYIDAGPSDWGGGAREVELDGEYRQATAEEFRRFKAGEHVWEEPTPEQLNEEVADRLERSGEYLGALQEVSALRFIADTAERFLAPDQGDMGTLEELRSALARRKPAALVPNDDEAIFNLIQRVSRMVMEDLSYVAPESMRTRGRRAIEQGLLRILRESKAHRLGDTEREAAQYRTRAHEEYHDSYRHPWHSPHCYEAGAHRDANLCNCGLTDLQRRVSRAEQSAAQDLQQAEEDGAVAMLEAIVGRLRHKAEMPETTGMQHAFRAAASEAQTMDDVATVQQAIRERKMRRRG